MINWKNEHEKLALEKGQKNYVLKKTNWKMLFQNQVFKKLINQEMSESCFFFSYLRKCLTFWNFCVKQLLQPHKPK